MPTLRRDKGVPSASERRDKDGEGRKVEGKSHCRRQTFEPPSVGTETAQRMTNELLEVEVSCAIFTHIITVSVATVTAAQREGRLAVGVQRHTYVK